MMRALILMTMIVATTIASHAAELPGAALGRPIRVHIARGLWWDMLRLHDAVGSIGGGEISSSVDVYGSPTGYHGAAEAMGTFPHTAAELERQDIIVLAGSRVAALPPATQSLLVAWVQAGGGLLITGGPMSLDRETYGPLAEILPVTIEPTERLQRVDAAMLAATPDGGLGDLDWTAKPRVYWIHSGVTLKAGSRVLMTAGDRPVLAMHAVGKGHVAVFSGTVCGDPAAGETAFWDWPEWPALMGRVLTQLAPRAAISLPAPAAAKPRAAVLKRLAEIGENGSDFLDDALDEALGEPKVKAGGGGEFGAEIAKLAANTRDAEMATAVVQAVASSGSSLSVAEGDAVYRAVAPYIPPADAARFGADLMKSTKAGTAALGLRLAGLGGDRSVGPAMVTVVARGLATLQRDTADGGMGGGGMQVPDGRDEALRLAAAQALADLADPKLIATLRTGHDKWLRARIENPALANARRDVDETVMAALAVMGDPAAAQGLVERMMANAVAQETAIDISEHRGRNPTPEALRQRKEAVQEARRLRIRQERLAQVMARLPRSTWSGLTTGAAERADEFATEALLLALAARDDAALVPADRQALETIMAATPSEAVRRLCAVRLGK